MALIPDRFFGGVAAALLAAGVLAAPLSVSAQTSPPSTPQAAPSAPSSAESAPAKGSSGVDAHITKLHKQLKITAAQESQWNAVADIMRENAKQIDALASQRASKRASMSAVDNLRSYEEIADAHAEGLKKLVPAFSALYDTMSDAQKKNADAVFAQQGRRGRARRS